MTGTGRVGERRSRSPARSPPRGLTLEEFQREYQYVEPTRKGAGAYARDCARGCRPGGACARDTLVGCLPVLGWLTSYDLKRDLAGDVIAGFTVAVMHIPQGMAYALLAGIPPIHGLYMAFCQCLLYAIFGTARHLSVGTFAVTCIMTGKVVQELSVATEGDTPPIGGTGGQNAPPWIPQYTPVEVATTVTLAVGLVELAMYVLRAGALTVLLSDMLVQGFTTGAAVHVLFSQLQALFGLTLPRYQGCGKLARLLVAVLKNLPNANAVASAMSATTILILFLCNQYLKPRVARRTRLPVPIELLMVIVATAVSYGLDLSGIHGVQIIGNVTTGLPPLSPPVTALLPAVLKDAIIIAVIAYSVSLSLAHMLSKKHSYTISANQELIAHGVTNVVSACFSCAPTAGSLSRSLILENAGGRTQLSGVVTAGLLLAVLLWLGPLFQLLPKCVLSSIIVVSLKGLLFQVRLFPRLFRISRADSLIWAVTFCAVVGGDIDIGLAAGVAASILVLLWRLQWPESELIGSAGNTGIYVSTEKYAGAQSETDVRIFRFGGALHFCNATHFRSKLAELTGVDTSATKATKGSQNARHRLSKRRRRSSTKDAKDPETLENGSVTCDPGSATSEEPGHAGRRRRLSLRRSISVERAANYTPIDNEAFVEGDEGVTVTDAEKANRQLTPLTMAPDASDVSEDENGKTNGKNKRYDDQLKQRNEPVPPSTKIEGHSSVRLDISFSHLVLDMSRVSFMDTASSRELIAILAEYSALGISSRLAGCNDGVLRILRLVGGEDIRNKLYPSVQDAVLSIKAEQSDHKSLMATPDSPT